MKYKHSINIDIYICIMSTHFTHVYIAYSYKHLWKIKPILFW
jgi:hypothetical protein